MVSKSLYSRINLDETQKGIFSAVAIGGFCKEVCIKSLLFLPPFSSVRRQFSILIKFAPVASSTFTLFKHKSSARIPSCIKIHSSKMRFFVIVASLLTVAFAVPIENGAVVGECDATTQLGQLQCDGTEGFTTCTHRGLLFRPCGPGTICQGDNICDVLASAAWEGV